MRDKIYSNPANGSIFALFGIVDDTDLQLENAKDATLEEDSDMGYFWNMIAAELPIESKFKWYNLGLIVVPKTGEIIAVHLDRDTLWIKADFDQIKVENTDSLRIAEFLGEIDQDIRPLGNDWVLGVHFLREESQLLQAAWKKYSA